MKIEFDIAKDRSNIDKHGISLSMAADFEVLSVLRDERYDYGEDRYRAWGLVDGIFHCLIFTIRNDNVRPISLRRAHKKEIKRYVQKDER